MGSGRRWELVFHVGDDFRARAAKLADPPFLNVVLIRFAVADAGAHYHMPLIVSPRSYSTYRGSCGPRPAAANMRRAATRAPRRDGAIRGPIECDARRFRIALREGAAMPVMPRRIDRKLGVRHDRRRHPGSSFVRQFCLDLVEERANPIPINGASIQVGAEGELTVV